MVRTTIETLVDFPERTEDILSATAVTLPIKDSLSMAKQREGLFGEEDCDRPACDDVKQAFPKSMEEFQALSDKYAAKKKVECPPRSADLGRSSWKLLHTMVCEKSFF